MEVQTDRITAAVVGALGAIAILIGMLLPAADAGLLPLQTNTLIQLDPFYIVFGLLIGYRVYRCFTQRYKPAWLVVLAIVASGFLAYDVSSMTWTNTVTHEAIDWSPGIGLYVTGLGVLLALVSGVTLWKIQRSQTAAVSAAPTTGPSALSAYAEEVEQANRERGYVRR